MRYGTGFLKQQYLYNTTRYTGNTLYTSCTQRKETTIMAALTLGEWRDRTLEQVHFAAKAALNAVVVQGHPRLRACVAATATGDLNQCLAQGPNIDAVRRIAQGMAVRFTAAPGVAPTPDTKGELSLNNLAEAMHRLGVENALCHLLQPHHVLPPHEVDLFFNQTFSVLVQDRYIADITEERHEFLEPHPTDDPLRFVKHEGSQRIFGIETKPDGSGVVYEVDLDARRLLHPVQEAQGRPVDKPRQHFQYPRGEFSRPYRRRVSSEISSMRLTKARA